MFMIKGFFVCCKNKPSFMLIKKNVTTADAKCVQYRLQNKNVNSFFLSCPKVFYQTCLSYQFFVVSQDAARLKLNR